MNGQANIEVEVDDNASIASVNNDFGGRIRRRETRWDPSQNTTLRNERAENVVWFDDGNLIVKVEARGRVFKHRIYSNLLAQHSAVFRDMLQFSAGHGQEMFEGCPVVQLHDEPGHVSWLFRVLYFPGMVPHEPLRQKTFDDLEPLLLLADKYEMVEFTNRLLPTLERDWPSTLDAWDRNEAEIQALEKICEKQTEPPTFVDDLLPEPCRVIRLAHDLHFDHLLPSAFYHLSRLDINWENADDDVGENNFFRDGGRCASRKYLSTRDWNSLYCGMAAIRAWCFHLIEEIHDSNLQFDLNDHCTIHYDMSGEYTTCLYSDKSVFRELERKLFCGDRGLSWGLDPLSTLDASTLKDHKLCSSCRSKLEVWLSANRKQFWKQLPLFFRLPPWSSTGSVNNHGDGDAPT